MKNYFKNFVYTLAMLFWINIINLTLTITGLFSMIFNRDSWWDRMCALYINIGTRFNNILKEDSEKRTILEEK